jgi:RNA polymerase sigma factor (sigma-70 family)
VDVHGRPGDSTGEPDVLAIAEPLRRYVAAHARDRHEVDDVVQETLARVLLARRPLEEGALLGYAIVVARNVLATHRRAEERAARNAPRILDLTEPARPEDSVLEQEEQQALATALATLPSPQRDGIVAHVLAGTSVSGLADSTGSSPGAVAAQLSRTRARLRLDYVLALRRAELPTARCRPVLLAISAGDRRRQQELGAGRHLVTCRACAEVSKPLLSRERALAGLVPALALPAAGMHVGGWLRRRDVQAVSGAVAAALAVGALWSAVSAGEPAPRSPAVAATSPAVPSASAGPRSGELRVAGGPVVWPLAGGAAAQGGRDRSAGQGGGAATPGLAGMAGARVRGKHLPVLEVPADEGFWVGSGAADRFWVQLTAGGESPQRVRPGQRVSFEGRVTAHGEDFPARVGVGAAGGAAALAGQGAHVAVADEHLRVVSGTVSGTVGGVVAD